jgi:hypothetical protein
MSEMFKSKVFADWRITAVVAFHLLQKIMVVVEGAVD